MKQSEKLKVLIDSIKTANELAAKQIEKNRRSIELLGEFITEPEKVETKTEIRPDAMYKDIYLLGGVPKGDKVPACLDGKGDTFIKPKDIKEGEWYVDSDGWIYKFSHISSANKIFTLKSYSPSSNCYYNYLCSLCDVKFIETIRKATQEEILRYFPNELELPTHGGNDAAYIQEVTDPQI